MWENVFHIVTYFFNLKRSAEAKYSENTAESENPKCHKSKELPLFQNFFMSTFNFGGSKTVTIKGFDYKFQHLSSGVSEIYFGLNYFYFLTVTESLGDGRMLCCFCILKTKNKHAICEICFDVIVEFVLGAQIMGTY